MKRIVPGLYKTTINGAQWTVFRIQEGRLRGWWMGRNEEDRFDYSDPLPTLRELKFSLRI